MAPPAPPAPPTPAPDLDDTSKLRERPEPLTPDELRPILHALSHTLRDASRLPTLAHDLLALLAPHPKMRLALLHRLCAAHTKLNAPADIADTTTFHVALAAQACPDYGAAIIKHMRSGAMELSPFALGLLLALARVRRFEQPSLDVIASLVGASLRMRYSASSSPWLERAVSAVPHLDAEALLLDAAAASASLHRDTNVPPLLRLAAALMDMPPPSGVPTLAAAVEATAPAPTTGGTGAAAVRLPPALRLAHLGHTLLIELFALHPMIRAEAIDLISARIVSRADSVHRWVALLGALVRSQPSGLLELTHKLRALVEHVLELPLSVARPLLATLLPLHAQRPELREQLVLLLRKAMFHREEEIRLTAVHGFMLLLHASNGATDTDSHIQLELLGFVRRAFTQQAKIRVVLYEGLVAAYAMQPSLRELILDLLGRQLRAMYVPVDEAGVGSQQETGAATAAGPLCPLDLSACFFCGRAAEVTLAEPLPHLLRAITRCVSLSVAEEAATAPLALAGLRLVVSDIAERLGACTLASLGLSGKQGMSQASVGAAAHLVHAQLLEKVLEALLEWSLVCCCGDANDGPEGASQPMLTAATALLPQAAKALFRLQLDVSSRLGEVKPGRGHAVVAVPALERDFPFSLSMAAAKRVLHLVVSNSCAGGGTMGAHLVRHALRAVRAGALEEAARASAALVDGTGPAATASDVAAASGDDWPALGRMLLALLPQAEAMRGKEASSGHAVVAPASEAVTNVAEGAPDAAAAPPKGKSKASSTRVPGRPGKAPTSTSRLQLVLDALLACITSLSAMSGLGPLGAMLLPLDADAATQTSVDALEMVEQFILLEMQPLLERLALNGSYREAETALEIVTRLAAVLPASRLRRAHEQHSALCHIDAQLPMNLRRAILALHLGFERRAHTKREAATRVATELHSLLGDNHTDGAEDGSDDVDGAAAPRPLLDEASANSLAAVLLESVEADLAEAAKVFELLQSARAADDATSLDAAASTSPLPPSATSEALERALCERYRIAASALRKLLRSQIDASPATHLLRSCAIYFRQLEALFKSVKAASPRLEALLEYVCGDEGLSTALYGMLAFQGASDAREAVSKVRRESQIVPGLIFALERFEAAVVKLAKASGVDLLRHMKRATARDFKISASAVAAKAVLAGGGGENAPLQQPHEPEGARPRQRRRTE